MTQPFATDYSWASSYYQVYESAYSEELASETPRQIAGLLFGLLSHAASNITRIDKTLRVLDIGAGDYNADFLKKLQDFYDELRIPRETLKILAERGIAIHWTILEPCEDFNKNTPEKHVLWNCGELNLELDLQVDRRPLDQHLAGNQELFHLIVSHHGLYTPLEICNAQASSPMERTALKTTLLDQIMEALHPLGCLWIRHSSKSTSEKRVSKFGPNTNHTQDPECAARLAVFQDTHAEFIIEHLFPRYPSFSMACSGLVNIPTEDDKLRNFTDYFFRITDTERRKDISKKLSDHFKNSLSGKTEISTLMYSIWVMKSISTLETWLIPSDIVSSSNITIRDSLCGVFEQSVASEARQRRDFSEKGNRFYDALNECITLHAYTPSLNEDHGLNLYAFDSRVRSIAKSESISDEVAASIPDNVVRTLVLYALLFARRDALPADMQDVLDSYPVVFDQTRVEFGQVSPFVFSLHEKSNSPFHNNQETGHPADVVWIKIPDCIDEINATVFRSLLNEHWSLFRMMWNNGMQHEPDALINTPAIKEFPTLLRKIHGVMEDSFSRVSSIISELNHQWDSYRRAMFGQPHLSSINDFAKYLIVRRQLLSHEQPSILIWPIWNIYHRRINMMLHYVGSLRGGHHFQSQVRRLNAAVDTMMTGLKLYHAQTRAARAAVFARNFSHITGSHVISNPEFRHSLVGEDLMRGFRRRLGESHQGFVNAENDLFRFMLEKAYKVEDLWTAGTKVLADAREEVGTGGRLMENTRRFHEYLQGRFDFIARAIDDVSDQPEPLWFVKDLVEGFLSQTAYLDTLVADLGLRRAKMEFVVKLPDSKGGSATFLAVWKPDPRTGALMVGWKNMHGTSGKIGDYATLVALPGGMVSAHAFYSLLENIIRNSAKYGSLKEIRQKNGTHYQMVIELVRGSDNQGSRKQHFDLRIWDNYSGTRKKDKDGNWVVDQVKPLQERLVQEFVKPTGEQATENLGMMEMQACAKMLYRGDVKGIYSDEQADHVCAVRDINNEERKRKARQFNLWTDEENEARKVDGHFLLTYHLTLNVPVLLATLTAKTGEGCLSYRTDSLEKVRTNWPHLLILDGTANGEGDKWLGDIAKNPEAVPYRTLVLCKDGSADCTKNWKDKIEGRGLTKRVQLLANKDLYELIFAEDNPDQEKETAAILAAYEAWLRAWKGTPTGGQWHLWIGMERPVDQVKEGWETAVRGFNIKPSSIRVSVRSFESGQAKDVLEVRHDDEDYHKATEVGEKAAKEMFQKEKEWDKAETPEKRYWLAERASDAKDKRALVFDNHGNCFPGAYEAEKVTDLEQGTRFYQKLSGTVSPDLFRTLCRPPADEFGFAFFIYSLVESCLTNIAVVDERVAWNLIEGGSGGAKNDHFAEHLAEHQKAGFFPVFRFRQEGAGTESGFYNAAHRELVKRCVSQTDVLDSEGVVFNAQIPSDSKIRFLRKTKCNNDSTFESIEASPDLPFAPDSPFAPDVLLIHEGAMDILTSEQGVEWKPRDDGKGAEERYLNALYALAPAIVRTSGRGRRSKLLGEHLPFIEFGEVSSALLTARNKFSLVRGLLGSAGTERKP